MTLSYTWGPPGSVLKTTDESEDDHREGIAFYTLPETLRDVIDVARSIDVDYIWIDSLCIIQQKKEDYPETDFDGEGPHMEEIYSNSMLTIAASVGEGTHVPCFQPRTPDLLTPAKFSAPKIQSRRYGSGHFYIIDQQFWESAVSGAPLNQRGWVLQERLLSPRTVHLCREQIFWECCELAACEALPSGLPKKIMERRGGLDLIPQNGFKSFISQSALAQNPNGPQSVNLAFERWYQIVETFSMCNFWNPADQIVAISGVAKRLNTTIKGDFIAGIWMERFIEGLAWEIHSGPEVTTRGKKPTCDKKECYCGPSWSWVSVDGHIKYDFSHSQISWQPCATFKNCHVEPEGQPAKDRKARQFQTPQKEGTVLSLTGPLYPIDIDWSDGTPRACVGGDWYIWEELFLDTTTIKDHINDDLMVAPILVGSPRARNGNNHMKALVLRGYKDSYERVGLLHAWKHTTVAKAARLLRGQNKTEYKIV